MEKDLLCTNFCGALISPHEVMKLQSFEFGVSEAHPQIYKTFHSWCSLHVFIDFMEKEPFTQFYGCLDHFKWTYEVAKVWMIKLCLEVSDVTHVMNIMHNMLIVACI